MSTITRNRLRFERQGAAITSANTTYPVDLVTDPNIRNVANAANSTTNGVGLPPAYANQDVVIRLTCSADDPPTCGASVYGYIRRVLTTAPNTFTEMDYTGSAVTEIPWDHLCNLNNDSTISVTTNAGSGVNRIATTANSWIYNEVIVVGAMYERIRVIPHVLTGTNVSLLVDVGVAGGQR